MDTPLGIFEQSVLTDLIRRPISTSFEDQPRLGDLIAPFKDVKARSAKIITTQNRAFGIGQFKAPAATPALYKDESTWQETVIELALQEEMMRINSEEWLKLNSSDETIRATAGASLVDKGMMLQRRNERLTEWMRWQAFAGELTITYPTGSQEYINYGLTAAQKPTVGTLWSNTASADPIADMRSWSSTIASLSGFYGTRYHMSSDTFEYLVRNASVRSLLTATDRPMLIPRKEDILSLLRDGTEIVLYDDGYRDEAVGTSRGVPDSLTRFLPRGKVLVTTDYVVDGLAIADTLDGQVVVNSGYNQIDIKQGPQAEVILDNLSKTHHLRVASARIPRLNVPECFLYATVA